MLGKGIRVSGGAQGIYVFISKSGSFLLAL